MNAGNDAATRALARIAACTVPGQLRTMIENAERAGDAAVATAARRRLYDVLPAARPGTLEHDVWRSIHALEDALRRERGKTVRLSRTRQKIGRDGELETVRSLIVGKLSDGFHMLIERDMPDLTFEAVALRHPDRFGAAELASARARLAAAGGSP